MGYSILLNRKIRGSGSKILYFFEGKYFARVCGMGGKPSAYTYTQSIPNIETHLETKLVNI